MQFLFVEHFFRVMCRVSRAVDDSYAVEDFFGFFCQFSSLVASASQFDPGNDYGDFMRDRKGGRSMNANN